MEDAMAMLWQEYVLGRRVNLRDNVKSVKCSERGGALYSFMSWSFRCGHKRRGSGTKITILTGPADRRHTPCHTGTHGEDSWVSLGSRKQGLGKCFTWKFFFFFSYWSFHGKGMGRDGKLFRIGYVWTVSAREEAPNCQVPGSVMTETEDHCLYLGCVDQTEGVRLCTG